MLLEFGMEAILSATASHKQTLANPMVDWRSETQRPMSSILKNPVNPFFITPPVFFCQVPSPNLTKKQLPNQPTFTAASRSPVFAGRRSPFPSMYWTAPIAWTRAMGGVGWLEVKYVDGWWMMWMIWMILYIQKIKSEIWALLKKQVVYLYVKWWARKGASEAWKARWSYHINDLSLKALAAFTGGPFDGGEPPFDRKTQTKETQHHPKSRFQEEDSNRPFRT